jgi:predicted membrane protein
MLLYIANLLGIWVPWKIFMMSYPLLISFAVVGLVMAVLAMKYNQRSLGIIGLILGVLAFILGPLIYGIRMFSVFLGNAPFLPWN